MKVKIKCTCCGNSIYVDEADLYDMVDAVEKKYRQENKKQAKKTHDAGFDDLMQLFGMKGK
jgi:rRNA maturation protein Nop10